MAYSPLIGAADGIGRLFGRVSGGSSDYGSGYGSSYGQMPVTGSFGPSFMSAGLSRNADSQRQGYPRPPSTGLGVSPGIGGFFSGSTPGLSGGNGLQAGVPPTYAQLIADGMRYQRIRDSLHALVDRMRQFYHLYRTVSETPGAPSLSGFASNMLSRFLEESPPGNFLGLSQAVSGLTPSADLLGGLSFGTPSSPSFDAQVSPHIGATPGQPSVTRDTIETSNSNKNSLPTQEPVKPTEPSAELPEEQLEKPPTVTEAPTEGRAKRETFAEQILSGATGESPSSNNEGSSSSLRTK